MALTYEQMCEILEEFKGKYPILSSNAVVHSIGIELSKQALSSQTELTPNSFEIVVASYSPLSAEVMDYSPLSYRVSGLSNFQNLDLQVRYSVEPVPTNEVLQGHGTRQVNGIGPGTVGHNFFLTGGVGAFCFMSCHHVIAVPNTTVGQLIETNDPDTTFPPGTDPWPDTAVLHTWRRDKSWDYALGRYLNAADAQMAYRQCANGTTRPYVSKFAKAPSVKDIHFKVGLTTRCTTGRLLGVRDIDALGMTGQLAFERMTRPGDSGSIIVHEQDLEIVGLHHSGVDYPSDPSLSRSFSCPIYQAGFQLVGHYEFLDGTRVPIYDPSDSILPVVPEESLSSAMPSYSNVAKGNEVEEIIVEGENINDSDFDASQLGGLLYLKTELVAKRGTAGAFRTISGLATRDGNIYTRIDWSDKPDPVPVSAGGRIAKVVVDIKTYRASERGPVFDNVQVGRMLYFG